jgi:hypothetical protein
LEAAAGLDVRIVRSASVIPTATISAYGDASSNEAMPPGLLLQGWPELRQSRLNTARYDALEGKEQKSMGLIDIDKQHQEAL